MTLLLYVSKDIMIPYISLNLYNNDIAILSSVKIYHDPLYFILAY